MNVGQTLWRVDHSLLWLFTTLQVVLVVGFGSDAGKDYWVRGPLRRCARNPYLDLDLASLFPRSFAIHGAPVGAKAGTSASSVV